jgi:nucleotide-binding universal stress UspA family protein
MNIMPYKHIMLAIDGSDASELALQEAIKLAQQQKAELRIIHIVDESYIYHGGPGFDYSSFIASIRNEGQRILDCAEETIRKHSQIKYESYLVELQPLQGRVAENIVAEANAWPADILVIGTHGRRGFSRLFLGSVAENIIRIATIPILLIRGDGNAIKKH